MSQTRRAALLLVALVAAGACLIADPVATPAAAAVAARAAAVAIGVLAAQMAFGATILRRLAPALLDRPAAPGHALAIGIGAHAALLFPLFALGRCDRVGAGAVLAGVALAALPSVPTLTTWARARPCVCSA